MTGFNSGYRATKGLPLANHDSLAWKWIGNMSGAFSGRCGVDVPEDARHAYHGEYDPSPEFDVPDNLILADLRRMLKGTETVQGFHEAMLNGVHVTAADDEYAHARRVLSKLAHLTETETS